MIEKTKLASVLQITLQGYGDNHELFSKALLREVRTVCRLHFQPFATHAWQTAEVWAQTITGCDGETVCEKQQDLQAGNPKKLQMGSDGLSGLTS